VDNLVENLWGAPSTGVDSPWTTDPRPVHPRPDGSTKARLSRDFVHRLRPRDVDKKNPTARVDTSGTTNKARTGTERGTTRLCRISPVGG
jgi:hypothetical protein